MSKGRNDQERWHAILDSLSDEISQMPDEQLMREFSQDANEEIAHTREILTGLLGDTTVAPHTVVSAALEDHERDHQAPNLPETPEARRRLLQEIMDGLHPWSGTATMAFRDLEDPADLPDEEIQSLLEDLAELSGDEDE